MQKNQQGGTKQAAIDAYLKVGNSNNSHPMSRRDSSSFVFVSISMGFQEKLLAHVGLSISFHRHAHLYVDGYSLTRKNL